MVNIERRQNMEKTSKQEDNPFNETIMEGIFYKANPPPYGSYALVRKHIMILVELCNDNFRIERARRRKVGKPWLLSAQLLGSSIERAWGQAGRDDDSWWEETGRCTNVLCQLLEIIHGKEFEPATLISELEELGILSDVEP